MEADGPFSMIGISITPAIFEAIAATFPLGSAGYGPRFSSLCSRVPLHAVGDFARRFCDA